VRRDLEYGRSGGQSLHLDAFLPRGSGPFPGILLVHGGGWVTGDRILNLEPLFEPLLGAGFACLSISYRLARDMTSIGAAVEDVEMATNYVAAHAGEFRIDKDKLALVGESAGGQLAAMAMFGQSAEAVKAAVLLYAPDGSGAPRQRVQFASRISAWRRARAAGRVPLGPSARAFSDS
jgi:acetyl esterase/lipase